MRRLINLALEMNISNRLIGSHLQILIFKRNVFSELVQYAYSVQFPFPVFVCDAFFYVKSAWMWPWKICMNPDYKTTSESFAVGSYKILYFGLKTKKNARFAVPEVG